MAASATEPKAVKGSRLADMVKMANGLSATRALAAILVVMIHAAIPYMTTQAPVIWLVHDSAHHVSIDVLIVWTNGFVMPLFFFLAGLSIAKSAMKIPFREFAWQRFRRLGATFLLAGVLIIPLLVFSWAIGLLWTERLTMENLASLKLPREFDGYLGPMHLWFLEYLLLMCICWSAIARIAQRWSFTTRVVQGKWTHGFLGSVSGSLAFAVGTSLILICDVDTPFRLISPFVPDVARTLHYSLFFVAGIWLAGMPQSFTTLRDSATKHLMISAAVFVALCPITFSYFENTLGTSGQWMLVGLQAVFSWCMVFGFLGAMMRWCSVRRESIRYVSEASFWLYLSHFPIVCAAQLVVWPMQICAWAKILIVAITGLVASLLLYQYCVRYSWLGAIINGSRKQHGASQGWRLELTWMSLVTVGIFLVAGLLWSGRGLVHGTNLHTVVEGRIYRSNRLKPHELEEIVLHHNIRSVISLFPGKPGDRWFDLQQNVCDQRDVKLTTLAFDESRVPSSADFERLQLALKNSPGPVLLVGGRCSPTLSGFGSAIALLVGEGSLEEAMGQLSMQYLQLEGVEHCIIAQPLRDYRDWLSVNGETHSSAIFCQWTQQVQTTGEELSAAKQQQPAWQAMMGAPRYPRRF